MKNPHQISLRQLRYFVTVAEELHFHRAAQRLNMSQPALSQRIKEMERELEVELFERIGHRVQLTDAGRMMLNPAKETLAQADGFRETAQRAARGESGQIKLAVTIASLFFRSIQNGVRDFQKDYPGVSLDIVQMTSGQALEALRRRKLDMCLMRPFSAPLPLDCIGTTIARDRLMLVLPVGHPQAHAKQIPLSAVVDEKFVSLSCKSLADQIATLWDKAALHPSIGQQAQNGPVLMALVAADLGIAILPSSLQAVRLDNVVWKKIEIDDQWTETSLNLVYHKDTLNQRLPATFIESLRSSADNVIRQFG
jgi:DNA-binding transcriptional LysR family regulator